MSGFNSKSKMAYFKDNVQTPEEQEDFNAQQYYYSRGDTGPAGEGQQYHGYPPPSGNYGPTAMQQQHMAPPMGIRQQSTPNPQSEGYPAMPQQSRSISHNTGASPNRGPASLGASSARDGINMMDVSNFPSLTPPVAPTRYGMMGGMGFGGPTGAYSVDNSGGGLGQQPNFSIQNEDFPALPGSGPSPPVSRQVVGLSGGSLQPGPGNRSDDLGMSTSAQGPAVRGNSTAVVGSSRSSNATSNSPQPQASSNGNQLAGSNAATGGLDGGATGVQLQQLVNSGDSDENSSPSSHPQDKYGLMGLLDVIKMTDRDLNTLALGTDLTTFGLNLSSTESLYLTFSSPFSDSVAPPESPPFSTPSCYLMQPPSLKPDHLSKMHIETLFYMFYSMPRDHLQTAAAVELYRRDWWFHSDLRMWMKMRPPPPDSQQSSSSPQFVFFDAALWEARVYAGNSLRMSGFLPEDEIAMVMKSQQPSSSGTVPSNSSSAPVANSTLLNQGSQSLGGSANSERPTQSTGSAVGVRAISGDGH